MMMKRVGCMGVCVFVVMAVAGAAESAAVNTALENVDVAELAREVGDKGWIVYGARGDNGTWDLFVSRPDGSQRRNITDTADFEEAAPRVSPGGKKMLYRRLDKGATINHDQWGFQGSLIVSNPDGTNPVVFGDEGGFPWASWLPDGGQLVCLTKKGIQFVDLATKTVVREMPRQGIYQQLFASPDGQWLCGTANHKGESWTVVRLHVADGSLNAVRAFQNCTADWFLDSKRIILSSRPSGQSANGGYGFTQLWMADGDGQHQQLIYGEDGFHIYGGALSPDGRYVLFTKGPKDGSGAEKAGAPIGVMRVSDAPTIGGESFDLRKVHPTTKDGPVLMLDTGWEPFWTYAEIGAAQ